jgi:hypothetical protein
VCWAWEPESSRCAALSAVATRTPQLENLKTVKARLWAQKNCQKFDDGGQGVAARGQAICDDILIDPEHSSGLLLVRAGRFQGCQRLVSQCEGAAKRPLAPAALAPFRQFQWRSESGNLQAPAYLTGACRIRRVVGICRRSSAHHKQLRKIPFILCASLPIMSLLLVPRNERLGAPRVFGRCLCDGVGWLILVAEANVANVRMCVPQTRRRRDQSGRVAIPSGSTSCRRRETVQTTRCSGGRKGFFLKRET